MTDSADPRSYLLQLDTKALLSNPPSTAWLVVADDATYCSVVPVSQIEMVLNDLSWELRPGDYNFAVERQGEGHSYLRPANHAAAENLVVVQSYDGLRAEDTELCEEYRLFHNLWWDANTREYLRFSDDGGEECVARLTDNRCELNVRHLQQYLSIRGMALVLYKDVHRRSPLPIGSLAEHERVETRIADNFCYEFTASEWFGGGSSNENSFSRLLGKRVMRPIEPRDSGIWPYTEPRSFELFIIGVDENGRVVEHSCDSAKLGNRFGANPSAPQYLTPVFFTRDVLGRYYNEPSKYEVGDGFVRCAGKWMLRVDTNHPDRVVAYLGDLGRDIPTRREQSHWKAHNVPPDGRAISTVAWRRNFMAEFADAEATDLAFRAAYRRLNAAWETRFGWPLFRRLDDADGHTLPTVRRLLANEQSELDQQVSLLAKALIDALNEEKLAEPLAAVADEKGLQKLRRWLEAHTAPDTKMHLDYLTQVQALRSSGAAHLKGAKYHSMLKRFGHDGRSPQMIFDELLRGGVEMLRQLLDWAETPDRGGGA